MLQQKIRQKRRTLRSIKKEATQLKLFNSDTEMCRNFFCHECTFIKINATSVIPEESRQLFRYGVEISSGMTSTIIFHSK